MIRSKWEQRIRRADELAAEYPFAAEGLRFYSHVTRLEKDLYAGMAGVGADLQLLVPKFPAFLESVAAAAPEPMAQCARDLRKREAEHWLDALNSFWRAAPQFQPEPGRAKELLACIFCNLTRNTWPIAANRYRRARLSARAPFAPHGRLAGVLRPEGDGGKRALICAFCATEWNIGRIVCPACGEEAAEKLAVYTADQFPHVRVEACDTCRNYIKTVDLTKNGRAVPVVDELAAIPLDLWAQQHAYVKLRANMLGI